MRKPVASGESPTVEDGFVSALGLGQPLDPTVREFFEPRFGQDFSRVRVHTGDAATRSAQAVNAVAYTVGQDIVFGAAQYAPQAPQGRSLLAHELTHVIQQTGNPSLQKNRMGEAFGANGALAHRSPAGVVARSKTHSDQDLFDMMQKFRSKNDHLSVSQQNKIFWAIKKSTDSDEVAYKFFDYYSGTFGQKMLLMTPAEEAKAKASDTLAETPSGGDTKLRSDVLGFPDERLGPLLLHEFAHTGHHTNWGGAYDFEEGQAYGIEYYYAERTGDTTRMSAIIGIISGAAGRWGATQGPAVQQNFKVTCALMRSLADLTKAGSSTLPPLAGKDGEDGRVMAAEFVANFRSLSSDLTTLWAYIQKNLRSFVVPII